MKTPEVMVKWGTHHQCFMNTHLIRKLHRSWSNGGIFVMNKCFMETFVIFGGKYHCTSYLFCLDSAALLLLILHQLYLFGRIQNQSAVQRYCVCSLYLVNAFTDLTKLLTFLHSTFHPHVHLFHSCHRTISPLS